MSEHSKDFTNYIDDRKNIDTPEALSDTVDGLADQIIAEMDKEERIKISKLGESELDHMQFAIGVYNRQQLDDRPADEDEQDLTDGYAPEKVVKRVWEKLREIYA